VFFWSWQTNGNFLARHALQADKKIKDKSIPQFQKEDALFSFEHLPHKMSVHGIDFMYTIPKLWPLRTNPQKSKH